MMTVHANCALFLMFAHAPMFARPRPLPPALVLPGRARAPLPRRAFRRSFACVRRSRISMMPEGPEVRTLCDQLLGSVGMTYLGTTFMGGRYVTHGMPLGHDAFHSLPESSGGDGGGAVVERWDAKGKFLYVALGGGGGGDADSDLLRSIWITLGMSGRFVHDNHPDRERARWYMEFGPAGTDVGGSGSGSNRKIYYLDQRNFGTVRYSTSRVELEKKLASLGPDLLRGDLDATKFVELARTKRRNGADVNVCKFLMDQKRIAGVGNYILAEGLYAANVDPFACLSEIPDGKLEALFECLRDIALRSYDAQGVTRPGGGSYRTLDGEKGKYQFELQCYGRKFDAKNRMVLRETDGPHGRTIWYVEDQLTVPRKMRAADGSVVVKGADEVDDGDEFGDPPSEEANGDADSDAPHGATLSALLRDPGWREALSDHISSPPFSHLATFVASERALGPVFPPESDTFSALDACPPRDVRVVILGQDPYHGPGQAHGYAFSVKRGTAVPPSLRNIFKEAAADEGIEVPRHGNLEGWAAQGVLLLNSVLTVPRGRASAHAGKGWEYFTDAVVRVLNAQESRIVFLLWGKAAEKKGQLVDRARHTVIVTSHPSPLGATKTKAPFIGSKCFSRANEVLEKAGHKKIDWNKL
mmetsp:Transcript_42845/g.84169  ORF Transcript_42845/g.84169 Transcript_42845/m.84169 type:complete len:643 (-) Transcript_42845:111-2039(-)